LPNEPALLWAQALLGPHWMTPYGPWVLAATGAAGAAVAAVLDYAVIGTAFDLPRLDALRQKRLFRAAVRAFNRFPFATVLGFALLPPPFYVVRVLAPNSGYPPGRYVAAVTQQRAGRRGQRGQPRTAGDRPRHHAHRPEARRQASQPQAEQQARHRAARAVGHEDVVGRRHLAGGHLGGQLQTGVDVAEA